MKAIQAAIMVTALGAQPGLAAPAKVAPVSVPAAISSEDLPLTARFASLLTDYRNCVLKQVDKGALADQQAMAQAAMAACALSRGALHAQLMADIEAQTPTPSAAVAQKAADTGLAQLDPMIEAAAIDWAHARYARAMY